MISTTILLYLFFSPCSILFNVLLIGKTRKSCYYYFILIWSCFSIFKLEIFGSNNNGPLYVFTANAETLCPQLVVDSRTSASGNFSSPAWPSPYPPDAVCFYRLQGVPWEGVKLTFIHFDLELPYSTAGCLSDYLELTTIDIHEQRTFRGRYCGRTIPGPLLFLDPIVELVFRSNHAVHHSGFFATYEFIDEAYITPPKLNGTSPCGGVVTGIGGVLTSPGYPLGYSAGLDCLWLIRVPYQHAIYLRVHELEFQGSIANCQKAQIGVYDGYEYALDETSIIKRFCGDLRYYKGGEEDRVLLSTRNRLLIRFTTTETSKPTSVSSSSASSPTSNGVGFRLIWSDVEFNSVENCTRMNRFPCKESRFCFTKGHVGGASNCPDLRHYCISNQLVCDNIQHCGEGDSSDERNCHKTPLIVMMVVIPLSLLLLSLTICFCYQTIRSRRIRNGNNEPICCLGDCYWSQTKGKKQHQKKKKKKKQLLMNQQFLRSNASNISSSNAATPCFTKHDLIFPPFHTDLAPLPRNVSSSYNKQQHQPTLGSPGASDIVSPASGFSDSESELGGSSSINNMNLNIGFHASTNNLYPTSYSFSCPTHGNFRLLIPSTNCTLPVLEEEYDVTDPDQYYYDDELLQSDLNTGGEEEEEEEEVGSTISSQNSDNLMVRRVGGGVGSKDHNNRFNAGKTISPTDVWRNSQQQQHGNNNKRIGFQLRRSFLQRSDAVWSDNDGKSSIGSSSPISNRGVHAAAGNICPRCNCSVDEQSSSQQGQGQVVEKSQQQQQKREDELRLQQWRKNRESGGMAGRLVGVPSLLRKQTMTSCSQQLQTGGGGGGALHQVDSGIDTSIENVKILTSFDSTNSNESNVSHNTVGDVGGGGGGGRWKHSPKSNTTTIVDDNEQQQRNNADKCINTCPTNLQQQGGQVSTDV